jgi:hypothetical protein
MAQVLIEIMTGKDHVEVVVRYAVKQLCDELFEWIEAWNCPDYHGHCSVFLPDRKK